MPIIRRTGESIVIACNIVMSVKKIEGDQVILTFDAPCHTKIERATPIDAEHVGANGWRLNWWRKLTEWTRGLF